MTNPELRANLQDIEELYGRYRQGRIAGGGDRQAALR